MYEMTFSEGYMGATKVTGSNYAAGRRLYGKELTDAIRAELKKNGISGVTAKVSGFSGGQHVTVTMTIERKHVLCFEDYYESNKDSIRPCDHVFYNGAYIRLADVEESERESVLRGNIGATYETMVHDGTTSYMNYDRTGNLFDEATESWIMFIKSIVESFNMDDSNSQVDYFNVHFYSNYRVKIK